MKDSIELPAPQRRSLEVTAKVIEQTLGEIDNLLRSRGQGMITKTVEAFYSEDERTRMLAAIVRMRQANIEMIQHLGLQSSHLREDRIINAKITHLWTVLIDSSSTGLKGFGGLPPSLAQVVDDHVNELLELLKGIV